MGRINPDQEVELAGDAAAAGCTHSGSIKLVRPSGPGCQECLETGGSWVHLRICMECGHVGCCDSSPGKHATAHFHASGHPVIRSIEPGESWGWCYQEEVVIGS